MSERIHLTISFIRNTMTNFEWLKNLTESLKNILLLFFYVLLAVVVYQYGFPFLKNEFARPDSNFRLKEINIGILQISNEINTSARTDTKKPQDIEVDAASIPATNYLDTALNKKGTRYWIYIGQFANGKWLTKNFSGPKAERLIALTDTYKRETAPLEISPGNWKLGKIIGLVKETETVNLVRIDTIKDNNCWAQVY